VIDPAMPMSYYFEDSSNTATNPDGSFMTVIYSSGPLLVSEQPTPGTPEGVYNWHVRAVDAAGNSSDWSSPWVVTVDNSSSLTIVKVTDPAGATGTFPVDVTRSDEYATHLDLYTGDLVDSEHASSYVLEDIPAGTYNITESVPEGWDFASMECGEGETQSVVNGGSYDVAVGENATCTITNTKRASITVTKYTDPVEDGPFQFTLSGGPGGQEGGRLRRPRFHKKRRDHSRRHRMVWRSRPGGRDTAGAPAGAAHQGGHAARDEDRLARSKAQNCR